MVSFAPARCAPCAPRSRQRCVPRHVGAHMSISQDQVVSIHYTLRDDAGEVIDRSAEGEPLSYLHGHGNLIPGLERELAGRKPGDRLQVKIAPGDGYGEYSPELVQRVPRRTLKGLADVRVGMRLQAHTPQGPRP